MSIPMNNTTVIEVRGQRRRLSPSERLLRDTLTGSCTHNVHWATHVLCMLLLCYPICVNGLETNMYL